MGVRHHGRTRDPRTSGRPWNHPPGLTPDLTPSTSLSPDLTPGPDPISPPTPPCAPGAPALPVCWPAGHSSQHLLPHLLTSGVTSGRSVRGDSGVSAKISGHFSLVGGGGILQGFRDFPRMCRWGLWSWWRPRVLSSSASCADLPASTALPKSVFQTLPPQPAGPVLHSTLRSSCSALEELLALSLSCIRLPHLGSHLPAQLPGRVDFTLSSL